MSSRVAWARNKLCNSIGAWRERTVVDGPLLRVGLALLMASILLIASWATAASLTRTVIIGTFFPYYSPTSVQIESGASISWENPTSDLHTITHDACRTNEGCAFDSGAIGPNRTFTLHQLPPGHYPYHCTLHPIMRGVLVVQELEFPEET